MIQLPVKSFMNGLRFVLVARRKSICFLSRYWLTISRMPKDPLKGPHDHLPICSVSTSMLPCPSSLSTLRTIFFFIDLKTVALFSSVRRLKSSSGGSGTLAISLMLLQYPGFCSTVMLILSFFQCSISVSFEGFATAVMKNVSESANTTRHATGKGCS